MEINQLPIKEGLFHIPETSGDQPYLIGSKCRICGYVSFPKREACVKCRALGTTEEIKLEMYGTLQTFTVMQVGPPDFPPPYLMGYVKLDEGPVVFTLLTGCEVRDDALHIGQKMELVIDKVKQDNQGNEIIGWKFKPAKVE